MHDNYRHTKGCQLYLSAVLQKTFAEKEINLYTYFTINALFCFVVRVLRNADTRELLSIQQARKY